MKKIVFTVMVIAALICLLAGFSFAEAPLSVMVGTNSVKLVPSRPIRSARAWVTNTAYTVGQVVSTGGRYYFCVTAGTSTNTAPTAWGTSVSDGTVTWRRVNKGERRGITICNDSTNTVYLSEGAPAVLNAGIKLNPVTGTYWEEEGFQDAVYAISGSVSNRVVISVK